MFGAIVGDIIGSPYERSRKYDFNAPFFREECRFTDDTVLTIATAYAIMNGRNYAEAYKEFGRKYPETGYGSAFKKWLESDDLSPYDSYGNGSAMRVSPIGWAFQKEFTMLKEAKDSAEATHNTEEGVKGAQAVALAIYMAKEDCSKKEIKEAITNRFGYDLTPTIEEIRPTYKFDCTCQGSVPQSIIAFLDSSDPIDAIQLAASLNGDTDTMAAIAGSIAEAYYGFIPSFFIDKVKEMLPESLWNIVNEFSAIYMGGKK